MGETKDKWSSTIRYKGEFDFQGVYHEINGWLGDREYDPSETKFKQADAGGKYEIEVKLKGERKTTPDFKNGIEVEIKAWALDKVSTLPGHAKPTSGRLEISIKSTQEEDFTGRFTEGKKKTLGNIYRFVVGKRDPSALNDGRDLDKEIRKFLNMKLDNK
jgi:hypothetical protein